MSAGRTASGRFAPGRSGNPSGRPKGARSRATLAAEALLDGEAEALARVVVERALAGCPVALKLAVERVLPRRAALDPPALAELHATVGRLVEHRPHDLLEQDVIQALALLAGVEVPGQRRRR